MANKITAWLLTLVGVVWLLPATGFDVLGATISTWIIGLSFLAIGVTKLMRAYGKKKRR